LEGAAGSYRVEFKATDSAGHVTTVQVADFEVQQ
jgi:methionine-rich copper-binding protein CopC